MTITIKDLDGKYRVSTVSDYMGPLHMQSDGETEIVNGQTDRVDRKGVRWTTKLSIVSAEEVRLESIADPSDADGDFCLTGADGAPTRDPVTYTAILRVSRKGDKIRLSGQIPHGKVSTVITMTKI